MENYQNEIFMKNSKIDKIDNVYQISKGTVKIDLEEGFGSGFFLKFNLNNKPFYCLMTNEHVISSQMVLNQTKIIIKYDNEKKNITIKLNPKNRLIQCFKQSLNLDATIVEIIPTDNITKEFKRDNFLSPKLGYDIPFIQAIKKEIQIIQYPEGGELSVSEGNIMDIYSQNQNMFLHGASTKKGSSGSPIVFKGETEVLGIHKGGVKGGLMEANIGIFIKKIIDKMNEKNVKPKGNMNIKYKNFQKTTYYLARILKPFGEKLGLECTNCRHKLEKHVPLINSLKSYSCQECGKTCTIKI